MWIYGIFFALLIVSTDKLRLCMIGQIILHRAVYDLIFLWFIHKKPQGICGKISALSTGTTNWLQAGEETK